MIRIQAELLLNQVVQKRAIQAGITYLEALELVKGEHPELIKLYLATVDLETAKQKRALSENVR
jgi:hypothetical protein